MLTSGTMDRGEIACLLSEGDQARRAVELQDELFPGALEVAELADGYAYRFPATGAWPDRFMAFIASERACCPFFTFELEFAPHGTALWLRLSGSSEIKRFVAENFPTATHS